MFDRKQAIKLIFLVFWLAVIISVSSSEAADFRVSVSHGRLSVQAEDASLTGIFQEIAGQSGFLLEVQLASDIRVEADFNNLDLAEGIKKLHENTIIIYQGGRIVRVVVGTDQSATMVDDLARFFLEVFPGLKAEAGILNALKDTSSYPFISAAVSDILSSPGSWRQTLIRLSEQVTPQIREELFERINPQLATYAEEQGILAGVSPDSYNHSRILVRYKDTITTEDIKALGKLAGAEIERQFTHISSNLYQLSVPDNLDVSSLLAIYNNHPLVEYAEADYKQYISAWPNDPSISLQYAHTLTSVSAAWDQTTGDPGVVIAVIDTGVDFVHEDLAANMWVNSGEIPANGVDDDGNGYVDDYYGINAISGSGSPLDDNGHGTHVAGIIGAVGNNSLGVAGVNWTCKIMALKFLDADANGSTSDAIECIDYAIAMGAHVTNNSWGGPSFSQSLEDAISRLNDNLITFVAAAGNDAANNDSVDFYPANYNVENVISVAASTDTPETLAGFSNYGALAVDVAAPGELIYSTSFSSAPTQNFYEEKSGTSMAAPYVAGIIGLMIAQNPTIVLNPFSIRQVLIDSCDKIPDLAGRVVSGGRVNVNSSLNVEAIPSVTVNAPNGGETWSETQNILWTATDSEQTGLGALTATLYYGSSSSSPWTQIAASQACTSGVQASYSWNTTGVDNGTYWIRVMVSDRTGVSGEDVSDASFTISDPPPAKAYADNLKEKKHNDCFIATAAYGSSLARPVSILGRFRDRYLLTNYWGRMFVEFYYENSPPIARYLSDKPLLKFVVRILLWPLVFLSWLILKAGPGVGLLILAGVIGMIFKAKFLNKGIICLLIIGSFLTVSQPVYAQNPGASGNDSEILKESHHEDFEMEEDYEDEETVENLSDVGSRIGVRFKLGHAYDRNSSAEFFDESNVEFGVDSAYSYEGEVLYVVPVNDYYQLAFGVSAAYLKRNLEVGVKGNFPSEYFGTITTVPVLVNLENRFVLRETVAVFLRLGLGYSFNHFNKGDYFDDMASANVPNRSYEYKTKADNSFAYRIGAGFEYFINKRFSAALLVDYLGTKPKIRVTEKETVVGTKTRSSPEISLNSFILSFGVSYYFEPDFGWFRKP